MQAEDLGRMVEEKKRGTARFLVNFGLMIRSVFILLFLVSGMACLHAQTAADSIQKDVDADARLQTLVNKDVEINSEGKEKGYRVQIYFGADKTQANEIKAKFLAEFPNDDVHAYDIYEVPNFKIRVGDFRTRLEAYAFLKKIKADFPMAFIVESDIEYDDGK